MVDVYGDADRLIGKRVDLGNGRSAFVPGSIPLGADGELAGGLKAAQTTLSQTKVTLAANAAQTIVAASPNLNGARVLNWTTAPIYLANGTTGTPASGAPSDYVPAASSGVPGQYECPYAPIDGLRAVGAAAGDLTVETW